MASSDDGSAEPRIALSWPLRVHHRRRGGRDERRLRLAQRVILLLVQRGGLQPFARRRAEALDHVVDVLDGLGQRRDDRLVGAELDDLAELLQRDGLGLLHLPGAFVQRLFAARGQQRRSLARKACALRRQLQAGGETRNVPSAQIDHGIAEMSQDDPGAGADHDRHAGDDGEGGKQAAPHAPFRKAEAPEPEFTNAESYRHLRCPALPLDDPSAAVSRYQVNKVGKSCGRDFAATEFVLRRAKTKRPA